MYRSVPRARSRCARMAPKPPAFRYGFRRSRQTALGHWLGHGAICAILGVVGKSVIAGAEAMPWNGSAPLLASASSGGSVPVAGSAFSARPAPYSSGPFVGLEPAQVTQSLKAASAKGVATARGAAEVAAAASATASATASAEVPAAAVAEASATGVGRRDRQVGATARQAQVYACLHAAARHHGVSSALLQAIAQVESGGNPGAINRNNRNGSQDIGLMQINSSWLPQLAQWQISQEDLFQPCVSAYVGAWILAENIDRLGPIWRAVGAYNARTPGLQWQYVKKVQKELARQRSAQPRLRQGGQAR